MLELGCGKGEYTVGLAHLFPDKNFIGVDIKGARMWTGAKDSYDSGMTNVAFLRTSIELISHFFAAGEVAEIWLTFPDPQMKKVNKRLTSSQCAPLASVETAVRIELDLYVRFYQFVSFFTNKLDVFDVQSAVEPLLFVIGFDRQNIVYQP